jgi:crotonobetainyl-CoA:carnitine CoA-transferase CaiB-like acyl-CoA transferase
MESLPGLPLSDIKVLDLSRLLPGPYATLVLAELGACVDKLEDPEGGDPTRQMPPLSGVESALFQGINRNKRSISLNLKAPAGAAAFRRLVRAYDVLVEGFRPGVMERLGLSFEALREDHPRLVYCSISGYGQTGPDRLRAGHDLNYLARAGVLGYGGEPDRPPCIPGVQIADVGGGSLFALVSILAALYERTRTGIGRYLDVSMMEGAVGFFHMHLAAAMAVGFDAWPLSRGREPLNGGYACYNLYPTSDGRWLSLGALEPKFFANLCQRLGRSELLEQAYDAGPGDQKVRTALTEIFRSKPLVHWLEFFQGLDVCLEPVLEGAEILSDLQLRARGMFVEEPEGHGTNAPHLRTPVRFGPVPIRPAPRLGQHSREILRGAGFQPQDIEQLRQELGADWPQESG